MHKLQHCRHDLLSSLYGPDWVNPVDRAGKKQLGNLRRAFPYPEASVTLLGKLTGHQLLKSTGFKASLMSQMLEKVWVGAQITASRALVLDAKSDTLVCLYQDYGLKHLPDDYGSSPATAE